MCLTSKVRNPKKGCSLFEKFPILAKEWDPKNELKPTEVSYGSKKKVGWICGTCQHQWNATVKSRSEGKGCPSCKIVNDKNRFSSRFPDVAKEWDPKNELKPTEVSYGSNLKVGWICGTCQHQWNATVSNRSKGNGCPSCKIVNDKNRFSSRFPDVAKEWDPKNELKPTEVSYGSNLKVGWICGTCQHQWNATVSNRSKGNGCPRCKESKGEKMVASILDKFNFMYEREKKFQNCKYRTHMRFDFAIQHKSKIFLIEF